MFLSLPSRVTSKPPVLPVLLSVDAATLVDSVVSHLPTYSVNIPRFRAYKPRSASAQIDCLTTP